MVDECTIFVISLFSEDEDKILKAIICHVHQLFLLFLIKGGLYVILNKDNHMYTLRTMLNVHGICKQ